MQPYIYLVIHILLVAISGCTPEPSTSLTCAEQTRSQCMNSAQCTLKLSEADVEHTYSCVQAQGICETNVVQSDLNGQQEGNTACTSLEGCEIIDEGCYCSCAGYGHTAVVDETEEECNCMCGGEAPPSCVESE